LPLLWSTEIFTSERAGCSKENELTVWNCNSVAELIIKNNKALTRYKQKAGNIQAMPLFFCGLLSVMQNV
jgi:hypothetical protein